MKVFRLRLKFDTCSLTDDSICCRNSKYPPPLSNRRMELDKFAAFNQLWHTRSHEAVKNVITFRMTNIFHNLSFFYWHCANSRKTERSKKTQCAASSSCVSLRRKDFPRTYLRAGLLNICARISPSSNDSWLGFGCLDFKLLRQFLRQPRICATLRVTLHRLCDVCTDRKSVV